MLRFVTSPDLKTGVGNEIFWSEIGSVFGERGGTSPPGISGRIPWGNMIGT